MDSVHDLHDGIRFLVGIIKRSKGNSFQSKFFVGNIKTERHFCQIVLTNLLDMSTHKKTWNVSLVQRGELVSSDCL